tara:strand:- start:49 stop:822 length:774 start_codon:yes stop_codon:yes gene_type:complete
MITIGSLFSGIGAFEYGLEMSIPNAKTLWQVEKEEFCQAILKKHWPNAEMFSDVRKVGSHNLKKITILTGGFPCQDISICNSKGAGLNGEKSNLWWEMWRITRELRPKIICVENSSVISIRGLSTVLGSLAEIGYDAEWATLRASWFGSPQKRDRCFIVGYPKGMSNNRRIIANTNKERIGAQKPIQPRRKAVNAYDHQGISEYWEKFKAPPPVCGVDHGISEGLYRKKRLEALGNSLVPQIAAYLGRKILESGLLD